MQHFALALDLKNDPALIEEYEAYHREVWPEVIAAIRHVGILEMKIFRLNQRMFMQMTTTDDYDPVVAQKYLSNDAKSKEWEQLMDRFQQRLPGYPLDQKWIEMDCCFDLSEQGV
ncbi:L-rhamnose mutarotase [Marinomonas sp. 15G1-11]|uniref:L-rhamnose mutarotase n=1 Tax=Marinomonas phaeophyticola TaxID=3004091 RepID=A0ABT4JRH2_9GAMM|nr:L-rhamnose mutarotase [Marinomonas sp. 15G1-11]MCZ2720987.1 L-rhamnose mutarotase [Marinomonas sp. 15G1-11]